MKNVRIVFFLLFSLNFAFAQVKSYKEKSNVANSSNACLWTVQYFANHIFKLTLNPKGYIKTENISDAVVLKPIAKTTHHSKNFNVKIQGDTVFVGNQNQIILTTQINNSNYKGFQIHLQNDEQIFGGGERALPLNRRGYKFNLYNNPWYGYGEGADNLNYSVPFFTSNKGYGLFFDNPSKGYADIAKTNNNIFEVGFESGELNVYVIQGKNYAEILESYHQLTGKQPLPPRWALGNLMSRFGYTSEQQLNEIAAKMKAGNIPVDAIIFDLFWFGDSIKGTMGNLDWVNKQAWPNPTKMIQDFKKSNIQTVLITEPFVLKSSLNYQASKPFHAVDSNGKPYLLNDFYFGEAGLIDLFRTDAQQWFWNKHKQQMNKGVEAWWGDLGEPEKHPSAVFHNLKDFGFKRLFNANEVHNLYGHTWTKMLYNNYAKDFPTKRLFSLNRSGFAGTQRYSIFPWTGDVSRSWSGLNAQLPVLLGMSMSGVPYVHSDAGGFAGGDGDNELYVRWLQMAAFTPIFRPHGTALYNVDKNAFSFPSEAALIDEPYQSYAKKAIDLRYQFLPYNYNLAYQQSKFGKPLMAPLYYYNSSDSFITSIVDQYYWGEQIIVAPILQKNTMQRSVYLPQQSKKYYKFNSSTNFESGFITDTASLNNQLIYVKEGSILPIWNKPVNANTAAFSTNQIQWQYYATNTNTINKYSLFNDDGITKNAVPHFIHCTVEEKEESFKMNFTFTDNSTISKQKEIAVQVFGLQKIPSKIIVNNALLNANSWSYNTTTQVLNIQCKQVSNTINVLVY